MRQLKQIELKPLTKWDDSQSDPSLTMQFSFNLEIDSEREKFSKVMKIFKYNPRATLSTNLDGQPYVNTQIKSSFSKNRVFIFPEPNPICIFYNSANKHLQNSYNLNNKFFSEKPHFDFNVHYEKFIEYFQETSEGIILLSTTIEGFINQLIPENFEFELKGKKLGKVEIEWLDINTKLRELIPKLIGIDFFKTNQKEYECICTIIDLRNDLVHLKRVLKANNTSYQLLFKRLLDFEHIKCSDSVYIFVNAVIPNYFIEINKLI